MFTAKLTNGQCHVNYDANLNCVVMDWNGYSSSEEFRLTNEQVLLLFTSKKADKILADASDLLLIDSSDQEWLSSNWIPRAITLGFKACALIKPKHHFNEVAMHNIVDQVNDQLFISFFTNKEQAKNWLKQQ